MRVGLIGFGFIGSNLYQRLQADSDDIEVAFVHNRCGHKLRGIPQDLVLDDLTNAARFRPDLIVEAADPSITRDFGKEFLSCAHYMPLSLTALADDKLKDGLCTVASHSGRTLLIAHGALVGLDSLIEWREMWTDVEIAFRKPPASLESQGRAVDGARIIFEGSVREAAALYPNNVNAMVACAFATTGLDRARARLIADPGIKHLELSVIAHGADGSSLTIHRRQPAMGVSGSEMASATLRSIKKVAGISGALDFV